MKKLGLLFICGLVSVFLFVGAATAKETVVVYTSLENEEAGRISESCKKRFA